MCVAENMLPKMILRLLQHLREKSSPPLGAAGAAPGDADATTNYKVKVDEADAFLSLLQDFCDMGTAMRNVIIRCLISGKIYTSLTSQQQPGRSEDSEYAAYMRRSAEKYETALNALPVPELSKKYCECPTLTTRLVHTTFLEELLFWTVKYEFPQKLVCLLLIMLPDQQYKEVFTRAFVFHYWRMSTMLDKSGISDSLSNR
jgi:E3 ubiquitin-protein ligase UBR3